MNKEEKAEIEKLAKKYIEFIAMIDGDETKCLKDFFKWAEVDEKYQNAAGVTIIVGRAADILSQKNQK